VLRAPSLSINPMPPRTTRKSDRRTVSDRTMVGTVQPACLSASGTKGRRYESTMNLRGRDTHRVSFHYWGWTARPFPLCLGVVGEVFVLTSPFIERDYRVRREKAPVHSGGKPARELGSLHPVAIRAAVEATRLLKPLVQRVARRLGERAGRNVSER
jgi:hypothetical protein